MGVKIRFLGAAGTVTGSKYLVEGGGKRLLVDVGMFQGERKWREENWKEPPVKLDQIHAVLLTHAHIDHTGLLPRYVKLGLRCPVYCSPATLDLTKLLLLDSARLQEEDAAFWTEKGSSRHHPPLPLYTVDDAKKAIELLRPVPFGKQAKIVEGVTAEWRRMGHILGAGSIALSIGGKKISFSGDIGRYDVPILKDPEAVSFGDLLLIESTYGDKLHGTEAPHDALAEIVNQTYARQGVIVIPSFAVGRAQQLLFYLRELKEAKRIPDIPVIVDSPMAFEATNLYGQNPDDYDEASLGIMKKGGSPFTVSKLHFIRDRTESIKLNGIKEPMIIISASGMLTGGRIMHHLKHRISDERNTVLFVGYQPKGGRGEQLKSGVSTVQIFGDEIPVRAHMAEMSGLSAHGDRSELLRWCKECKERPGNVAIVHGEPETAQQFRKTLQVEMKWEPFCAEYLREFEV